jgi:hypothetical protein
MSWIDQAERNFGHLAIPHLIRTVAMLNALVFVLYKLNPYFLNWLMLDPEAVMRGEVWRVFSYVLIPSFGGPVVDWLFAALYIYYIWWIGDGVEEAMGSFRLNLYYLLGIVGTTGAAFITGDGSFGNSLLNSSLFFAFARFYPDTTIYFMMILPVKVKWMAWFSAAMILLGFISNGWGYRAVTLAALANYLLFFGKEIFQAAEQRREVDSRRKRFAKAQLPEDAALHRCEVCGRTEQVAPELEFRVARDGKEYCTEHLPKVTAAS